MPSAREDYLIRLIQQLGEALRRLKARLSGKVESGDAADVEREAGEAITSLLGPHAILVQHLDATSAVRTVADPDRVALWAELLRVQAHAQRLSGRGDAASRLEARAAALEGAATKAWPK